MIVELIGRLHPMLVHMPIGVMVLYVLFGYLQILGKMDISNRIMNIILFIGILTGIASIISGYTLSIHDSYDTSKLDIHKWTAIGTISLILAYGYFNIKYVINKKIRIILLAIVLILIIVTGHLGGTLSYGENYFNFLSQDEEQKKSIIQYNISDIENANVFEDLIMVSLKQKCIECHGPTKQKGELRLDSRDWILKGGKHGQIINVSDPASSEMLKRIFIDLNEEQHMPPKRKTQLEDDEINLIEWWINAGSPFNTKVSEVEKTNLIDSILHAYHNKMTSQKKVTKSERPSIKPIPEETIRSLVESGWVISILSRNDNHVRITGFNIEKNIDSCIDQLLKIKEYIVELKLSFNDLNQDHILKIVQLENLEKLWLDHCFSEERSIRNLSSLKHLTYLNLSNNKLSVEEILSLKNLPKLEKLYVQGLDIGMDKMNLIKKEMPKTLVQLNIDTMTTVASDSLFKKKSAVH